MAPTPVLLVAGIDTADAQVTGLSLLADLPRATAVAVGRQGERMTWCAYDAVDVVDRGSEVLTTACHACALRSATVSVLIDLQQINSGPLVVILPPGTEPLPFAVGITRGEHVGMPVRELLDLRAVVTSLSHRDLPELVFAESRPGSVDDADEDTHQVRSAVLAQVEFADVIALAHGPLDPTSERLLAHLCRPDSLVVTDICALPSTVLLGRRHDIDAAIDAVDPRSCRPSGASNSHGVTTVDVCSWRPMHPERFLDRIDALGVSRARARGSFWLPGRPDTVIACDAAAGFVSLGAAGTWQHRRRGTRLVVTTRDEYADEVAEAFYSSLMTDRELATGHERWLGCPDGFEPWVKTQTHHA